MRKKYKCIDENFKVGRYCIKDKVLECAFHNPNHYFCAVPSMVAGLEERFLIHKDMVENNPHIFEPVAREFEIVGDGPEKNIFHLQYNGRLFLDNAKEFIVDTLNAATPEGKMQLIKEFQKWWEAEDIPNFNEAVETFANL